MLDDLLAPDHRQDIIKLAAESTRDRAGHAGEQSILGDRTVTDTPSSR